MASQGLASRVYAPRTAFAIATVLTYLTNWAIALIPLLAIMAILGQPFSWALLSIPAGMLLTALFALGVGLLVATLGASFHDFKLTYQVLLTAWLYATPIIYPLGIVPERYHRFFELNPLLYLCSTVRDPAYLSEPAPVAVWLIATLVSLTMAILGWWVFTTRRNVLEHLG